MKSRKASMYMICVFAVEERITRACLTVAACSMVQLKNLEMEARNSRTVTAVILGGGAGTRLFPLTKTRAKPAVNLSLFGYYL